MSLQLACSVDDLAPAEALKVDLADGAGAKVPVAVVRDSDGSWHAILQDDNAHAWAEIYLSGQGWTPLEVTPGMTAELTEGELAADAAQAGQNAADSDTPLPARQEADSPAETPQSVPLLWVLPTVLLLLTPTARCRLV